VTTLPRTERLLLERYVPEDADAFVALFQDTKVSQWMGDGPSSEEDDRALFGRIFTKVYAQNLYSRTWCSDWCIDGIRPLAYASGTTRSARELPWSFRASRHWLHSGGSVVVLAGPVHTKQVCGTPRRVLQKNAPTSA
jgi:hypothetical protein